MIPVKANILTCPKLTLIGRLLAMETFLTSITQVWLFLIRRTGSSLRLNSFVLVGLFSSMEILLDQVLGMHSERFSSLLVCWMKWVRIGWLTMRAFCIWFMIPWWTRILIGKQHEIVTSAYTLNIIIPYKNVESGILHLLDYASVFNKNYILKFQSYKHKQ